MSDPHASRILTRTTGALLACAILGGCEKPTAREPFVHLDLENSTAEASYLAPPSVTGAVADRTGAVIVTGRAGPKAQVVLSTPEGETLHASANAQGVWTLSLPQAGHPRLFAISSRQAGRTVHAEGALVTLPHARVAAVMVRAGYAALPIGTGGHLDIVAVDYDPNGFAGVSGVATPRSPVRLSVDGLPAGVTETDAQGRFAVLAANRPLSFGSHVLEAATPGGVVRQTVELTPPTPLNGPYSASSVPAGWTVEWALNGGGVQTTLVMAPPHA